MKLKRGGQPGFWSSADGQWEFSFWHAARRWHVYRRGDEEPATWTGFNRLWEAVEWAKGQPEDNPGLD